MARSNVRVSEKKMLAIDAILVLAKAQRPRGRQSIAEIAGYFDVSSSYVTNRSRIVRAALAGEVSTAALRSGGGLKPSVVQVMSLGDPDAFGPPRGVDDLGVEALQALEDIEFFARRYYGIVLLPWQVHAARRIVELLGTPFEEFAVINVAPGSGKTAFFGRILPAWLTMRDRAMRGMVGSATNLVASKIVDLLRRDFTRARPDSLSERDKRQGLVQAESVLGADFGRIRPDVEGHLWTRGSFEVAQLDDAQTSQKEPTWSAMGVDTTFIGWRVDFALWDDLWDPRKVKSQDAKDEVFKWFDDVAEARIEPGGLFLLQGQRLAPDDIYAYALAKRDEPEDDEGLEGLLDLEVIGDGSRAVKKYHHIVYKAYDESLDTGPASRRTTAAPWPDGPLLSPFRIKWQKLRQIRLNRPDQFSLVYQQEDHDLEEVLVNPLWVSGGQGSDGEYHPGCRDLDRFFWEVPEGLRKPAVSVAMTDPSHVKMWGNLWYLWNPAADDAADVRHVMAMEWRRMQAPDFLEYNSATKTFHGLMENWWQQSKELGVPITHWIVEENGAQRYLLQHDFVRQWQALRGVRIIGHTTGRKKLDPDLGVQSLAPVYRRGLIRLPWAGVNAKGPTKDPKILELVKQMTQFPHGKDDLVMASWFFEANMDKIRPARSSGVPQHRPGFMSAFQRNRGRAA